MGGGYDSVKALKGIFSTSRYMDEMGCENQFDKVVEPRNLIAAREHGHVLRGAYLDAFARLEGAVMEQIAGLALTATPNAPFSHKLGRLAKARERFNDPSTFDARLGAIGRLNEVRTDIVHSVLTVIVRYDGTKPMDYRFGFQNACDKTKPLTIVTIDDLKAMAREAMHLAAWLRKQTATTPTAPASAT